eukprot:m.63892 g.63892  ORF g.63892 m.63892 type:complete len:122 (-) comp17815_c0_seq5:4949-5314(-)
MRSLGHVAVVMQPRPRTFPGHAASRSVGTRTTTFSSIVGNIATSQQLQTQHRMSEWPSNTALVPTPHTHVVISLMFAIQIAVLLGCGCPVAVQKRVRAGLDALEVETPTDVNFVRCSAEFC